MNYNAFPRSPWSQKTAPQEQVFYVIDSNGGLHKATSYEYNVSIALHEAGLQFLFQVSYWGGRNFLGGVVLDFLVFTVPMRTPVFVNGDYWHQGQRRDLDLLQTALLGAIPHTREPVILWGQDTETLDAARKSVRLKIL